MGLTGIILEVEFRMAKIPSPWLWGEIERVHSVGAVPRRLGRAAADWPFTKGWIDCVSRGKNLGRGIMYRARWATPAEAPPRPPEAQEGVRDPVLPAAVGA